MKSYKGETSVSISEHFKSSEFKCRCGLNHTYKINEKLVELLEKIFTKIDCKKIVINSGFRCADYSIKVGGYENDQHTQGNAVDIKVYDKNDNIINSSIICCVCQDIGFTGIARINKNSVHVDVRDKGLYYGDETKSNKTVTTDFYKYFNLSKSDVYTNGSELEIILNGKTIYKGVIQK